MERLYSKFLVTLLLCIAGAKAHAYDIEVKNADGVTIYYNYTSDGKELIVTHAAHDLAYLHYSGTVVIPKEVTYMGRTRKVTGIGEDAFSRSYYLTSITIPNSVTSIGKSAFFFCTSLSSVTIPNGVTTIEDYTFSCSALTSITIPNSVTKIRPGAFEGCKSLVSIKIPKSVINIGDTDINFGGFEYEFDYSSNNPFIDCNALSSIIVESGNPKYDSRNGCNAIIRTSSNRLMAGCKNTTIPNSVTSIGHSAFYHCTGLASIAIPNSVTQIGTQAFDGCSGLTSIRIPNSVMTIGPGAFGFCTGLTSITIPNSVKEIGSGAFEYVDLTSVVSQIENPFMINTDTFNADTFYNATLYVPKGTMGKYKATEGWKKFIFIEEGVPSGINQAESDENRILKRYTINGNTVTTPKKGINIIRMDNGVVKKVIVR